MDKSKSVYDIVCEPPNHKSVYDIVCEPPNYKSVYDIVCEPPEPSPKFVDDIDCESYNEIFNRCKKCKNEYMLLTKKDNNICYNCKNKKKCYNCFNCIIS